MDQSLMMQQAIEHQQAGRLAEAEQLYWQILALQPDNADARNNLAMTLFQAGRLDESMTAFGQALASRPDHVLAMNNFANVLSALGRIDEAVACYRRTLELRPDYDGARDNLARTLMDARRYADAIVEFQKLLTARPDLVEAHSNLASLYAHVGRLDDALASHNRALALRPDLAQVRSNRVYTLNFHPAYDAAANLREQRHWSQIHADPQKPRIIPCANDRSPDRRLRIGYVSPDFRDHVVGRNILPLFRHHVHQHFEVFCYANHPQDDPFTSVLRRHADHWRDIHALDDDCAADLIRRDGIDILIDLALHMSGNRLLVFARKPAPIQVTFAGYPGGTGLDTIDYRLTDPWLDPPGHDLFYVEKSIRLPDSFWCYDVEGMCLDQSPPVQPLPALTRGHVTFGCLNNFTKINDQVLEIWRRVLDAVAGSRILVRAAPGENRALLSAALNNRVDFVPPQQQRLPYLETYHQIDVGLDSFPYNGHTTSLDSFWMGVPVVTLPGQTAVSRAGWSQLNNLNLPELAAKTPEEYVSIAATLAHDLPRLGRLRSTLRQRMRASPLMDAPRFARNIESAYRDMWR